MCVKQLEEGRAEVEKHTAAWCARRATGPPEAHRRKCSRWCPASGAASARYLRAAWASAQNTQPTTQSSSFGLTEYVAEEPSECISGLVLQGIMKP